MPGSKLPVAWVVICFCSCSLTLHSPLSLLLPVSQDSSRIAACRYCFGVLWPPFYLGYSPIGSWDSLSDYVHPVITCLAFWASDWPGTFWASLSDYPPLIGVYLSMTFVKLIMIGHCCDCLGGRLNCLGSTCWLIVISKGQSCTIDCALAHSSNGFRIASGRHRA